MNYNNIRIFQVGGQIAWHNRRYTSDEIKKIQSALNKQALGEQLEVDGKMGNKTIAAIRKFQEQHKNELKVDGLAGDQTISALGITGIGNSSLTPTRKGQYQGRVSTGTTSKVDAQASAYYNSPEMIKYLMNSTNAAIGSPEYFNHYLNALKYVSPEIASKLRAVNGDGDAYDEEVARNRAAAHNRKVGILEAKNAMASGLLKTAEQLDRWMKTHNLSVEEMNEIMRDPDLIAAGLVDATRLDNGRVQRNYLTYAGENAARDAMNEAAVNYVLPAEGAAVGLMAGPLAYLGSLAGGETVNKGIDLTTNGKATSFGDLMSKLFGDGSKYDAIKYELFNPGTIAGGLGGARIAGYTPASNGVKFKITNPRAGQTYITLHGKVPVRTGTMVVSPDGMQAAVVPGKATGIGTSPVYGMVERPGMVRTRPKYVTKTVGRTKTTKGLGDLGYAPNFINPETSDLTPTVLEVPTYDQGLTYGPYIGINRTVAVEKQGGKLNYLNY